MRRSCRHVLAVAAIAGMTSIAACSSGGSAQVPDPATDAQASARLLAPGKAPGFVVMRANLPSRPARAQPFTPPLGSLDHVCTSLSTPANFSPNPSAGAGENVFLPRQQQLRYLPFPPSWFEWIDPYPGAEAAGIVKALPALVGKCGNFEYLSGAAASAKIHARLALTPLRGLGDRALYVSVRLLSSVPGRFWADDWIAIRSDRTLIFVNGQYLRPVGSAHDRMTLQLAREAWDHYAAA